MRRPVLDCCGQELEDSSALESSGHFLLSGAGLPNLLLEGLVLIIVSLVIYRFLARRASGD